MAPVEPRYRCSASGGRGAHPILQVTNALARSITTRADRDQAQIGSNLSYAAIQQLGGQAGRGRKVAIPARRICRSQKRPAQAKRPRCGPGRPSGCSVPGR
ncbi:phage virion morphogenesis protein [Pseudomonas aeruginosa]|uniref:phage virion morphogenesis protein n=1 Tax=Pseudomonas aeruginosa TaxID=287 RepID=UPI0021A82CBD|nr:phage virion morphogenesis protein [Pseudomonas aeruginosa]